jgi:hypothetical protein
MIAFSDDGTHYRTRERCEIARIAHNILYSVWNPYPNVIVETYLVPKGAWHVRVHKIFSSIALSTIEGGFVIPKSDFDRDSIIVTSDSARAISSSSEEFSAIVDMSPSQPRTARIHSPHGNTNVMIPRGVVPQLLGEVKAGVCTVFACAVLAGPKADDMQSWWQEFPECPTIEVLEELFKSGRDVEICKPA